jgi:hypothetical protein
LVQFVVILYIFFPFWYVWTDKNLATLDTEPKIGRERKQME